MKFRKLFMLLEDLSRKDLQKHFSDISDETFNAVVSLDPTATDKNIGRYTNWLLNLYRKNKLKDTSNVSSLLSTFDKERKNLERKNISKYNSIEDLQKTLKGQGKKRSSEVEKKNIKTLYRDDTWVVETPTSYEASCDAYGKTTSWCTASKLHGSHYYDNYTKNGALYIVRKISSTKPEAQFYIRKGDLVEGQDRRNEAYDENKLFDNYPKLKKFFSKLMPNYFKGNIIRVAGRRLKYTVDADGTYVFDSIDISDANLTEIPEKLKRLA